MRTDEVQKTRDYILRLRKPMPPVGPGFQGFPGQWSPLNFDPNDQLPDLSVNQTSKPEPKAIMSVQPMKFSTLAELAHDSPIVCLEGKIINLYAAKKGDGQYGPWVIQNGVISDGSLRHDIAFMSEETVLDESVKGKTVRICAQEYKNKMTGVKLTDKKVNGKQKRTVEVKFPATVEILGANGSASPASPQSTETQPMKQPTHTHTSAPAGDEPAEVRIANFRRVFRAVCETFGHNPDTEEEALSPSDLKEISTGIVMSFKEGYIHRPPYFADSSQVAETMADQEAQLGKARAATESDHGGTDSPNKTTNGKPKSWREFVHPKDGVTFGDMELNDPERLGKLIDWAQKGKSPPDLRPTLEQLLLADKEVTPAASCKVSKGLVDAGMGTSFDEEDVDAVCQDQFGVDFADLGYGQLVELGNNLDEHVATAQAKFTARQPKPTKKKAVVKPKAEDEDDSGMPD